ncbi:3-phosphoshikimate 1-carboxyvinyltransferase [Buchnera aphidicola]|uniref:3-phosphoshikimate 1-carboxyvinyltransferase n=1 Tax=Buchnera aphidicola TaxID=9 RepID=UPI0030EF3466
MKDKLLLKSVKVVNGVINLPGSKSITNRALLLSSVCKGTTCLKNMLYSDDVKYMLKALTKLGIQYNFKKKKKICYVQGIGKNFFKINKISLFLGNSGTSIRFLLSMLSLEKNNIILTGNKRMKERPIKHLVDALIQGGAKIKYLDEQGYPSILTKGNFIGGKIFLNGNISSQFLSSLLMSAPLSKKNTKIYIKNLLVSKPYIDLTINIMKSFGVKIINNEYKSFYIKGSQQYISPKNYFIEGDASSASYFLAAAAIKGGQVKVKGIGKNSIQGDIKFCNVLKKMGAYIKIKKNYIICKKKKNILNKIDMDFNDIPDVAMTVVILALKAKKVSYIRNIYNWRVKETDRLFAISTELKKLGVKIFEGLDFIGITPTKKLNHVNIETYDDHRIAMCFSLISLFNCDVTILKPNCVKKTFPKYFSKLQSIFYY